MGHVDIAKVSSEHFIGWWRKASEIVGGTVWMVDIGGHRLHLEVTVGAKCFAGDGVSRREFRATMKH